MSSSQKPTRNILESAALLTGGAAARRPVLTLLIIGLVTAALAPFAAGVDYDDDVLEFLPQGTPEIRHFREIGKRFHGLSVAVIGVEAANGDLFTLDRLRLLRQITVGLRSVEGVSSTTGFTEQQDISIEGETTVVQDLVGELPKTGPAGPLVKTLRKRVLSRDHIRGFLVAPDGAATLLLANLDPAFPVKEVAERIRAAIEKWAGPDGSGLKFHFGGAPFIGSYVARVARQDILSLSPWVAVAVILIVLVTARSFLGALIALGSVGVTIVWIIGLLCLLGRPLTLVSSSLPMLLMALGSAYSIHLLARILGEIDGGKSRFDAVMASLRAVGPPIIVAGLTTAIGFISFLVMDIQPMREFGGLMAAGTIGVGFLGLMTVSAASGLLPLAPRSGSRAPHWARAVMVGGAKTVSRHPMIALMGVTLFLTGTVMSFKRLDADINMQVFFDAGSEPVLAENFLEERLGGALFVQVEVTGDIKDPLVLRQMERLGDLAAAQEGVTGVQSVVVPMTLGARGLTGQARIPASSKSARAIAALLADADPAMGMLVDRKWAHALLQIKVSAKKTQAVLALVEVLKTQGTSLTGDRVAIPRAALTETQRHLEVEEVTAHVLNLAARHKKPPPVADQVRRVLNGDGALPPETAKAVITLLRRDIVTDEMLYLAPGADFEGFATRVAQLALAGQLTKKALYAQALKIVSDDEKKNPKGLKKAVGSLHTGIMATTAAARTQQRITTLIGSHSGPYAEAIRRSISVLDDPYASLPASKTTTVGSRQVALSSKVSGYPVVYDTMNRSVYQNQTRSLILAAVLVLLTLVLFFRSLVVAVIALVPAALTLAVVFGIMGLAKIPMDVGTSMVASIALGVGIDYAVHLVWRAQGDAETDRWPAILGTTGWGIIINVLEVTAGFAILMLGTLVPMRHVGLLVAVAMIVAALTTLTLIPAALDWLRARRLRSSSCS